VDGSCERGNKSSGFIKCVTDLFLKLCQYTHLALANLKVFCSFSGTSTPKTKCMRLTQPN
jgi:hypothetical protein